MKIWDSVLLKLLKKNIKKLKTLPSVVWLNKHVLVGMTKIKIPHGKNRNVNPAQVKTTPTQLKRIFFGQNTSFILLIFAFALFNKTPHQFICPQFWAEDGVIFFTEAMKNGAHAFTTPYAGYLHLIPRSVAFLATFLPIIYSPFIYFYFSNIILLVLAWSYLSLCKQSHSGLFLVFSIVLVPTRGEIFTSLTNLQWVIAPFILIIFYSDTRLSKLSKAFFSLALFFVCLTGPFSIFFFPFVIATFFVQKNSIYRFINLAIYFLGTFTQIICLLGSDRHQKTPLAIKSCLSFFFVNFLGSTFMGKFALKAPILGAAIGVTFTFWILSCVYRLAGKDKIMALCLIASSGGLLFASFAADEGISMGPFAGGSRYFYIPSLLIIWLIGIFVLKLHEVRFVNMFFLTLIVFSAIISFRNPPFVDLQWYKTMKKSDRSETILINPPPWKISIPKDLETGYWKSD